jgi:hypothetical protein
MIGKIKQTKLLRSLKHLIYNPIIIFLVVVLLTVGNIIAVFRINYVENFQLVYRWDRVTVILSESKYFETYRSHDFAITKAGGTQNLLAGSLTSDAATSFDPFLGIPSKVTETASDENFRIKTDLIREGPNNFTLIRSITIQDPLKAQELEFLYFQLVLGGGNIAYSDINKSLRFGKCEVVIKPEQEYYMVYKEPESVILFAQNVAGESNIKFNINFTINCG